MKTIVVGDFEITAYLWPMALLFILYVLAPMPTLVEFVMFLLCFNVRRLPPGDPQCL